MRLYPQNGDAAYSARLKQAFCGDVDGALFASIAHLLTPDAPLGVFTTPVAASLERWGALRRHYIMCLEDWAIRPRLQQRFIAEADAFTPGNPTRPSLSSRPPRLSADAGIRLGKEVDTRH